jgi:hypothetical protein
MLRLPGAQVVLKHFDVLGLQDERRGVTTHFPPPISLP